MGKRTKIKKEDVPLIAQLTVKQQKFVHETLAGKSHQQAVIDAGYNVKRPEIAAVMGQQIINKPHVKMALAQIIDDQYPEMKKLATMALKRILKGTATEVISIDCPHCQKTFEHEIEASVTKDSDTIRAIETLCKITGDFAPTKSAKLVANVDKWKLPEE